MKSLTELWSRLIVVVTCVIILCQANQFPEEERARIEREDDFVAPRKRPQSQNGGQDSDTGVCFGDGML